MGGSCGWREGHGRVLSAPCQGLLTIQFLNSLPGHLQPIILRKDMSQPWRDDWHCYKMYSAGAAKYSAARSLH